MPPIAATFQASRAVHPGIIPTKKHALEAKACATSTSAIKAERVHICQSWQMALPIQDPWDEALHLPSFTTKHQPKVGRYIIYMDLMGYSD